MYIKQGCGFIKFIIKNIKVLTLVICLIVTSLSSSQIYAITDKSKAFTQSVFESQAAEGNNVGETQTQSETQIQINTQESTYVDNSTATNIDNQTVNADIEKQPQDIVEQPQKEEQPVMPKIIVKRNKTRKEKEEFVNAMYTIGKAHEAESAIPPALFVAQACYESGYGSSRYAVKRNNLFGFIGYTYNSPEESIAAYEKTLNGKRYRHLIGGTLKEWVYGIGPAGYCDNEDYGKELWRVIKMWGLDTRE